MGLGYTSPPLTSSFIREQLAQFNGLLGFEEKLIDGVLDTVDKWTETTLISGTVTNDLGGGYKLATGVTMGGSALLKSNRNLGAENNIIGRVSSVIKKMVLECTLVFSNKTVLSDDTLFGFAYNTGTKHGDVFSTGLTVDTHKIYAYSKQNAAENTVDIDSSITANVPFRLRMEFFENNTKFYIDGVLVATLITEVSGWYHIVHFIKNDAATDTSMWIRNLRIWGEIEE